MGVMSDMNRYGRYGLSKDWIAQSPKIHSRLVDMKLHSWGKTYYGWPLCPVAKCSAEFRSVSENTSSLSAGLSDLSVDHRILI